MAGKKVFTPEEKARLQENLFSAYNLAKVSGEKFNLIRWAEANEVNVPTCRGWLIKVTRHSSPKSDTPAQPKRKYTRACRDFQRTPDRPPIITASGILQSEVVDLRQKIKLLQADVERLTQELDECYRYIGKNTVQNSD